MSDVVGYISLGIAVLATTLSFIFSLKKKQVLFLKIVFCAQACFLLGQLFYIASNHILGSISVFISVQDLSWCGFYLFLYSGESGAMDSLCDNKSGEYKKYRLLPLILPVAIVAIHVVYVLSSHDFVLALIYTVPMSLYGYYMAKHLIFPEPENGFVRALRPYYVACLLFMLFDLGNCFLEAFSLFDAAATVELFMDGALIAVSLLAYSGVKKW